MEDIIDVLSIYNTQVQNSLIMFNSIFSVKTSQLRKKRNQHYQNIKILQRKQLEIIQKLQMDDTKRVWTMTQSSRYWEKEVPTYTDDMFKERFRICRNTFELLCNELKTLEKVDTNYRKSIPLQKRVAISLYTLGNGVEYREIGSLFGVGKSTISNMLTQFYRETFKQIKPKYTIKKEYNEGEPVDDDEELFKRFFVKFEEHSEDSKSNLRFIQLSARFKRLGCLEKHSEKNVSIIKVCCVLQDFLTAHNDTIKPEWLMIKQES